MDFDGFWMLFVSILKSLALTLGCTSCFMPLLALRLRPQEPVDDEHSEEWLKMLQNRAGAELRDAFSLKPCTTKAREP